MLLTIYTIEQKIIAIKNRVCLQLTCGLCCKTIGQIVIIAVCIVLQYNALAFISIHKDISILVHNLRIACFTIQTPSKSRFIIVRS